MDHSSKTAPGPGQQTPTLNEGPGAAPAVSLADALGTGQTFGPGDVPTELTPPQVPGYELMRELGRGGMGVVYLAREIALNRLVALKLMSSLGLAADLARFRTEAEAVAALRHPNIVQIYAIGEVDGRPFVALEFVEGGTLAQQLHGLPCSPHIAAALLVTLAEAIHYAHRCGIVHRDLKPSNVLVSPSGVDVGAPLESGPRRLHPQGLKIADFGLAKRMDQTDSQTQTGLVMGTPEYMAPEQAAGRSRLIGPAADIYALGALLYEMLTGRPPHRGILPMDTLLQVLHDEPVRPSRLVPKLPRDLETICLKCLEKDPARRYASALDLAADLRCFLTDRPILARPLGPVQRAWRWCRRNRLAAAGLTAAGLFFLLGSAASLTFGLLALHRAADAEVARSAEGDAKGRAERQYNLTRDTVDRLLPLALTLRASQDVNLGRQQALDLAVEMYDKLLRETPDDLDLFAKVTDLRLQLGMVCNELQQPAAALPHLQAARRDFESLARREPANYHFRYQEASAAYNQGLSLRVLGRPHAALDQMTLAITRWQVMLVDLPAKDVPRTLESAHLLRTLVCLEIDDVAGARAALSQAERFSTLPVEPWQMATINAWQRARRQALQARLELWDRRPAHAVTLLRQALHAWNLAEQESKLVQARSWEKLAMRVELARALALANDLAAARQELADALQPTQEPALAQTTFLNVTLNRVRGLRLRARLEALDAPATAWNTLVEAERLAAEMARTCPGSVLLGLEWLRVLNDQLEGFATPPLAAERERLHAAAAKLLQDFQTQAERVSLVREQQRSVAAAASATDPANTLGWTKWLPEESAVDVQLRLWSAQVEWTAADDDALQRLLAEQMERARAGERLARVNVAAALVLAAQRHPEQRVASLRQALAALTELSAETPECWEIQVRLAFTADLLADASGAAADRARAVQWREALPPHAQRLLRRWPETPPPRARPPATIPL